MFVNHAFTHNLFASQFLAQEKKRREEEKKKKAAEDQKEQAGVVIKFDDDKEQTKKEKNVGEGKAEDPGNMLAVIALCDGCWFLISAR